MCLPLQLPSREYSGRTTFTRIRWLTGFRPASYSSATATRSKLTKEEIKWQELLSRTFDYHLVTKARYQNKLTCADFRAVQSRHEKARRQLHNTDAYSISSMHYTSPSQTFISGAPGSGSGLGSAGGTIGPGGKGGTAKKRATPRASFDGTGIGTGTGTGAVGGGGGGTTRGMSPLNPKRGGTGSGSGLGGGVGVGVGIGGAVASMNASAHAQQGHGQGQGQGSGSGSGSGSWTGQGQGQSQGLVRSTSPPIPRRKILGGMGRRAGGT